MQPQSARQRSIRNILGTLLLFFVIHLLTITETGIHVSDNQLVWVNSPYAIFQTQLVLGVFGVLPTVIFVVGAIVRDYERRTIELFFTTPVPAIGTQTTSVSAWGEASASARLGSRATIDGIPVSGTGRV